MNENNFYVSTPIYYVNDKPHIGHAYTTILADVLARYHRLIGAPTFFLTGTDEHGQKVEQAAKAAGISALQQVDATVPRFINLWKKLEITHNDFIRTTEPRHVRVVQAILSELYAKGEIYQAEYDGWYCTPCERFFTERDLTGDKCPECGRDIENIRESNYFFTMSAYQNWLIEYIEAHPEFIQPDFRRNETLGFLRKPLQDLCISRPKARLSWGIELPFDSDYVTYVWFDALVNYISAIGYPNDLATFNTWWPATYHLIGKDILTTHTVYWPTMLKAIGLPMPKCVFAHGWWLVGREKMSKSLGNVVDPMALAERYGVDAFRYFLMAEMTLGQDASFTQEAFVRRYNVDLANDLGNSLSRVRRLILSHFDGRIPDGGNAGSDETALRDVATAAARAAIDNVERMRVDLAVSGLTGVVRETNRYLERRAPWTLCKSGQTGEAAKVLYCAAETLRIVSGMLFPIMPGKMRELRDALGCPTADPDFATLATWGVLQAGVKIGDAPPLFPRVLEHEPAATASAAAAEPAPSAPIAAPPADSARNFITLDQFKAIELKTASILTAEPVEGSSKLLRLSVDMAGETRQLVAGIAASYSPSELPGKTVVIVANLKPATIHGIESQGMLLAVTVDNKPRLLTTDGPAPSGLTVC